MSKRSPSKKNTPETSQEFQATTLKTSGEGQKQGRGGTPGENPHSPPLKNGVPEEIRGGGNPPRSKKESRNATHIKMKPENRGGDVGNGEINTKHNGRVYPSIGHIKSQTVSFGKTDDWEEARVDLIGKAGDQKLLLPGLSLLT